VLVAVLDSGVHASHPHVDAGAVIESAAIDAGFADTVDRLGHGTAVAAAILDLAPAARLLVGKVFDRSLATNATVLADGIAWAVDRGARLINLSLGTQNRAHEEKLRASVAHASARGALVVSARDGDVWLPGAFSDVVGVVADARLERNEFGLDDAGFHATPFPRPIPGVPKERNLRGVSFAVANLTGALARLLEAQPEIRGIAGVQAALRSP
jgi:hypothetical protein